MKVECTHPATRRMVANVWKCSRCGTLLEGNVREICQPSLSDADVAQLRARFSRKRNNLTQGRLFG